MYTFPVSQIRPRRSWQIKHFLAVLANPFSDTPRAPAMASIDRTAYPRFRGQLTDAELEAEFTLSEDEEAFVRRHARGEAGRLSMAVTLKTRQRLARI
jgi:hypothetical protein